MKNLITFLITIAAIWCIGVFISYVGYAGKMKIEPFIARTPIYAAFPAAIYAAIVFYSKNKRMMKLKEFLVFSIVSIPFIVVLQPIADNIIVKFGLTTLMPRLGNRIDIFYFRPGSFEDSIFTALVAVILVFPMIMYTRHATNSRNQ
ncbi:hypothetical protein [Polycladidibacter stylochi]|uniref:hypothetical protein n=1 Tax=Polycladidibacter stylochi TaxID=1807766 RepID=UPI000829EE14|nr:hypothetical protein [Pseudovibrio stylochi]